MSEKTSRQWHVANWTALGWWETGLKLAAIVIGVVALIGALTDGMFALPEGVRLGQLIIMVVLSLGLVAAIFDRIIEREIIAMVFVLVNNLGHWGMVVGLLSVSEIGNLVVLFCALMMLGDLVKFYFLISTGFTTRNFSRRVMFGLTGFYIAGYAAVLLLELLR